MLGIVELAEGMHVAGCKPRSAADFMQLCACMHIRLERQVSGLCRLSACLGSPDRRLVELAADQAALHSQFTHAQRMPCKSQTSTGPG